MKRRRGGMWKRICLLFLLSAAPAWATDFPSRPVRIVVPYAAGGPADILARLVSQRLSERTGQQFIVDNRPGAAGSIGAGQVARSPADGYTLLVAPVGVIAINPWIYSNLPYDALRDFQPVTLLAKSPFVLAVNPNLPVKTVQEFIAFGKNNPGKLRIANPGIGTGQHLTAVYFSTGARIETVQVPYRGSAPGTTDLLAGVVEAQFDLAPLLPYIKSGQVRALAVTSRERLASLPDIPTVAEAGIPGFEMEAWNSLVAPAGTPPEVVKKLADEVAEALKSPELLSNLKGQGYEPGGQRPAEVAAFFKAEQEKYRSVVKAANLPMN